MVRCSALAIRFTKAFSVHLWYISCSSAFLVQRICSLRKQKCCVEVTSIIDTTCAVGVWGRLAAPEDLLVSPVQGDKVALHGRNRTILGAFTTLQTSPQQATRSAFFAFGRA